ncbi:MAG: hypothetical protein BWX85_01215 [Chloroflexi bacterium ADurb.Bin120]|nr:MAG: hypothetical protein BWX85_01215 [Chloroflexi bacterium ADurb.Bin120]
MGFDDRQNLIQPRKHIRENHIRVGLAGVKDHIGKDGDHLRKRFHPFEKGLIQAGHLRPKLDASHAEIALKTFGEIFIQFCVLCRSELKILRDVNIVSRRLAFSKENRKGAHTHLM